MSKAEILSGDLISKILALSALYDEELSHGWFELQYWDAKDECRNVYLEARHRFKYYSLVSEFTKSFPALANISASEQNEIVNGMLSAARKGTLVPESIQEGLSVIKEYEFTDHTIFKPIWGLKNVKRWQMGCIQILDLDEFKKELQGNSVVGSSLLQSIQNVLHNEYLGASHFIGFTEKGKSSERVKEHAHATMEVFENILRFMVGPFAYKHCSIFYRQSPRTWGDVYLSENQSGFQAEGNTLRGEVDFEEVLRNGSDILVLLELATAARKPSKYQTRILRAASMIGSAYLEGNPVNSFLKCVIALESLFTISENELVSPSITEQMSLAMAYLLGQNLESRQEVYTQMKKIYGLRSKVVHGDAFHISKENYFSIAEMTSTVIRRIVTEEPFKGFSDFDHFREWLHGKKLSSP